MSKHFFYITLLLISFNSIAQELDNQIEISSKRLSLGEVIEAMEISGLARISHSLDAQELNNPIDLSGDNYELDYLLNILADQCNLEYMSIGNQIVLRKSSNVRRPEPAVLVNKEKDIQTEVENDAIETRDYKEIKGINVKQLNDGLANYLEKRAKIKYRKNEHKLNYTDELISIDGTLTGTQILLKALNNLKYTYHIKPMVLSGIYSEVWEQDGKTALFVESLVDIYDKGLDTDSDDQDHFREEVYIQNIRRSDNYIHPHIFGNISKFNSLDAVLRWNGVKYKADHLPDRLVSEAYTTEGVVNVNNKPAYKIKFEEQIGGLNYQDIYYIDVANFSIIRYEKKASANSGYYLDNQFKLTNKNNLLFKLKNEYTFYDFEFSNGKAHIAHAGSGGSANIVNTHTGSVIFKIDIQRDLDINQVKSTRKRPSKKLKMDTNQSIYSQSKGYFPRYWDQTKYNYLQVLSGEQIIELERKNPIEDQFRNN